MKTTPLTTSAITMRESKTTNNSPLPFRTTCKENDDSSNLRLTLNQTRVGLAEGQDYVAAEGMLGQISDIRQETESRIKHALRMKHLKDVCSNNYIILKQEDMENHHR